MIFELSHENITTALREYMDKRDIIRGKDFTYHIRAGRKGNKTNVAVITMVDPTTENKPAQLELVYAVEKATVEVPEVELVEGTKSNPFRALFAK